MPEGRLVKINRQWHESHKMARTATLEQRLDWHLAHAANCACREMPERIRRELEARGLVAPTLQSLK
jgi:hypothetical protein